MLRIKYATMERGLDVLRDSHAARTWELPLRPESACVCENGWVMAGRGKVLANWPPRIAVYLGVEGVKSPPSARLTQVRGWPGR